MSNAHEDLRRFTRFASWATGIIGLGFASAFGLPALGLVDAMDAMNALLVLMAIVITVLALRLLHEIGR